MKIIGTLLPLFSLKNGKNLTEKNGTINDGLAFLDWLVKTHQSAWQMLPIYETHLIPGSIRQHIASPYKGYGVGIDPKYLPIQPEKPSTEELSNFLQNNEYWLPDYALFCALRDHFRTDDWTKWEKGIRARNQDNLNIWKKKLAREINSYVSIQWQLHNAYKKLRDEAKAKKIMLIGDLPFYLPLQSPLVWVYQKAFLIDKLPIRYVSGVPDGPNEWYKRQVWGHPLYNWSDTSRYQHILDLWKLRLRYIHELFDMIRFDHAVGFYRYGIIDLLDETKDKTVNGPGSKIYEQLIAYCRKIRISYYAEDAAAELEDLHDTMRKFQIPGVRVLTDIYNPLTGQITNTYDSPINYPANCVAYTTTHDKKTLLGFLQDIDARKKERLAKIIGIQYLEDTMQFAHSLRKAVINSTAQIIILPIQDWLLTTDRINIPGTEKEKEDPNWQYRLPVCIEDLPEITISS